MVRWNVKIKFLRHFSNDCFSSHWISPWVNLLNLWVHLRQVCPILQDRTSSDPLLASQDFETLPVFLKLKRISLQFYVRISDINKFLWMVRIGGSTERGKHIKEWDYYSPAGEFRIDSGGSATMLNSLMYKLCYYNFGKVYSEGSKLPILWYGWVFENYPYWVFELHGKRKSWISLVPFHKLR